ncbi:MAG: N-acetylmuramoyl-L-alanine amidase [Massilia sp.]|nr:N-acetylmuramoyl-L-alanine amidase [Massilia sp.]
MTFKTWLAGALFGLGVLLAPAATLAVPASHPLADVESRIVPVAGWGGTPADPARARLQTITHITLHHQGEPFPQGKDPVAYLRNLQTWSRATKGWLDIPYHFIIDLDGGIYEGRKLEYAGDTNTEYDPTGHALIEVVGNFEEVEPNQGQFDAVVDLMAMLAAKYQLPVDSIAGHKDHSAQTVCPGANLYRYLQNGYFRDQVALRLGQRK